MSPVTFSSFSPLAGPLSGSGAALGGVKPAAPRFGNTSSGAGPVEGDGEPSANGKAPGAADSSSADAASGSTGADQVPVAERGTDATTPQTDALKTEKTWSQSLAEAISELLHSALESLLNLLDSAKAWLTAKFESLTSQSDKKKPATEESEPADGPVDPLSADNNAAAESDVEAVVDTSATETDDDSDGPAAADDSEE